MNNCNLIGRLTHQPELKATSSGIDICNFQMAVDRKYTKKGEEKQTDFIDCTAWRSTAQFIVNYFNKGSRIAVDGALQTQSFTDREGHRRKTYSVNVENVYQCGGEPPKEQTKITNNDVDVIDDDDDFPF